MPEYVPRHDRPPYYSSLPSPPPSQNLPSPRYASPDLDPDQPYPWTRQGIAMSLHGEEESGDTAEYGTQNVEYSQEQYDAEAAAEEQAYATEAGPSRKRPRPIEGEPSYQNGHASSSRPSSGSSFQPRQRQQLAQPPRPLRIADMQIIPSFFGLAPRNEFTKRVGDFLMEYCRGQQNIEIEMKLGTVMAVANPSQQPQRVRMPTWSEMILPPDYPTGGFVANMLKHRNKQLNQLLNTAAAAAQTSPVPVRFFRARHTDSFHDSGRGDKVRVTRDRDNEDQVVAVIKKKRLSNLNVYNPNQALDWRVSVSIEEPCKSLLLNMNQADAVSGEMPSGPITMIREKDRACYQHQLCQVDLTVVTTKSPKTGQATGVSYELEIEILDVPTLIAEGEKEIQGLPNRFDEMLQSCLDTVRMLVRNVE
ncbi:CYTH-like domain-containing protein [Naematelia encephala]|uniref:mRNA-capping enzyme subunit beta n=1 Tax=Naematelia encephala TaxID=71784 RepID=A0A1Y2AMU3_9TREE|nr:CYTH-like domain-containing protein [Naematelia encephala]